MAIQETTTELSGLERDENRSLISASKVRGTAVYDSSGERIGSVDDIMLTKRGAGEVAYAILSFGGFLGIGEKFHPLPWNALDYDTDIGGYRVGAQGEAFRDAPSYNRNIFETDADWPRATDDWYDRATGSGSIRRRGVDFGTTGL